MRETPAFDLDAYVARSGGLDLSAIDWDEVPRYPLPAGAVRSLRYMEDIEGHTIIYLRALLATRAIDAPEVAVFLACWVYEETLHGLALARFLEAAGHPLPPRARPHRQEPFAQRLEASAIALVSNREGERDGFVYVLVEGRALLVKESSLGTAPSRIGELQVGDTFGELKIVDPRPSTASVVAATAVTVVAIDLEVFDRHDALGDTHATVWRNVGQILAERLQRTSITGADAIQRELAEREARAYAARFILFMFCTFGVFQLGISALSLVPAPNRPPTSVLSFILIFWTVIPVVLSLRRSPFPLAAHGLTARHAGRHAIQALAWTAPVLIACLLVKLVLTRTAPSMAGRPLFDPAALFGGGPVDWGFFAVAVLLYAVHTPIQEFVARAGLQGSLQQFLRVPAGHADWKSIVISNVVFASAHTYLGFWFSMAAFASGLLWGWIFARQGSLVGPIVSHLAVGYWVLFALGLHAVIGGG